MTTSPDRCPRPAGEAAAAAPRRQVLAGLAGLALAPAILLRPEAARAETKAEIDAGVKAALRELRETAPWTRDIARRAVATLVFPKIVKGGVLLGALHGEGALLQGNRTVGYYDMTGLTLGLQAGGQSYALALYIMTQEAMDYLKESKGWEIGVGPSVVVGDESWAAEAGTTKSRADVVAVFFHREGVMIGASLQGTKISRIDRQAPALAAAGPDGTAGWPRMAAGPGCRRPSSAASA